MAKDAKSGPTFADNQARLEPLLAKLHDRRHRPPHRRHTRQRRQAVRNAVSPIDRKPIAMVARGTAADIDRAASAAKAAFKPWAA